MKTSSGRTSTMSIRTLPSRLTLRDSSGSCNRLRISGSAWSSYRPKNDMVESRIHILLIEDNPGDAELLEVMLAQVSGAPFSLECADRLAKGLARLSAGGIDIVLLDLSLPDSHGLDTFRSVKAAAPSVPIVVLSGTSDEMLAVKAVHEGSQDYLVK